MEKLTREEVIEKLEKDDKNFKGLDLSGLDLSGLDLSYADLYNTNLSMADLENAHLEHSDLSNAILYCADLSNADLSNADLSNVILYGTNLDDAILDKKEQIRKGLILKDKMIGYKKCIDDIIVTLEIPKDAIVFSINNNKCRTNKAKVIEISDGKTIAKSKFVENFIYELGHEIEIEDFDLSYNVECSTGIHFFRTREEAEKY